MPPSLAPAQRLALLACCIAFVAPLCYGQQSRGSITGKVTDAQSAVVPAVPVIATNVETTVASRTTTNQTGYYEINNLDPGTYTVSVEAPGFKKLIRAGIILNTGDRLAVDLRLEVGAASTTVEVTSDAPLIETTSAAGGRVIDDRDVKQLPYTSMNPFALQAIAPGVTFTGNLGIARVMDNAGTASYAVNGLVTSGGNEFLLDGAPVTGTNGGRAGFDPSSEAVGEIRIETSPFDASVGHTIGAVTSATIKSGTNAFHGSLFDQSQQTRLNATPHFSRLSYQAGLANGSIAPGTPEQPSGKLNQPGFSIGGPVWIPKVFNGKSKLFFYFQYDRITQIQPNPSTPIYSVPTAAQLTGDFSALYAINPVEYTIYDPRSATLVNGHVTRTPFPGNKVPILNPAYKFYSQVYPLPNNPPNAQPDGTNNYYDGSQVYADYFWSVINRYDYNLNDKMRISGKWYGNNRLADGYDWGHTTPLVGIESNGLVRKNIGGSGNFTYTINANNVLDLGLSVTQYGEGDSKPILTKYKATDAGLPAYIDQKAAGFDDLPAFNISGYAANAGGSLTYPGLSQLGTTDQFTSHMTSIRGAHTFHYGWEERLYYYGTVIPGGYPTGTFTYDNTYFKQMDNTSTAGSLGLSWAAFEMGIPTSASLTTNDTGYYGTRYHALYLQDDYRATGKLRFGFGLRFEREGGTTERYNRGLSGGYNFAFVPDYAQAVQAAYAANPAPQLPARQFNVAGGVNYLGQPYKNYTNGTNRFLPNVSVVYSFDPKTVIRAGTGWYADTFNALVSSGSRPSQNGFSQTTTTAISNDNGLTFCCGVGPASNLSNVNIMNDPFPLLANGQRFVLPVGNSLGSNILDGQSFTYYPRDYKPALQQRWKISIQREIAKDQVIDVSYNGAYATSPVNRNLSYLPEQYWNETDSRNSAVDTANTAPVPNPFNIANLGSLQQSNPKLYNYLSTVGFFTAKTLPVQQLLRAYPNAGGGLTEAGGFEGKTVYHDIQALYTKRFSKGFQTSVIYTRAWSRQQWQPNQFNQSLSWQPNPNSRPNRFVWTAVWELPFGKGKEWLNHGLAEHVVGGWQLSVVYQYQSGPLINWGNLFYYGSLDQLVSALNHDKVHSQNIHQWFDPAADYNNVINPADSATGAIPSGFVGFEGRSAFQPGTYQARIFPQYVDALRADPIRNWDTKIYRRFNLHERINLNVALDMLNMTNHTQFSGPVTSVTGTNFGQVTSQANSPRQLQMNVRLEF